MSTISSRLEGVEIVGREELRLPLPLAGGGPLGMGGDDGTRPLLTTQSRLSLMLLLVSLGDNDLGEEMGRTLACPRLQPSRLRPPEQS